HGTDYLPASPGRTLMKISALVLLAAGAAGLIGSAAASAAERPAAVRVAFADLNLATDAGVEQLYTRLRNASDQVCGVGSIRELKAFAIASACAAATLSNAVEQVHSDKLSARHQLGLAAPRVAAL